MLNKCKRRAAGAQGSKKGGDGEGEGLE